MIQQTQTKSLFIISCFITETSDSEMKKAKIILLKHEDTVALEPGVIIDESFKNTRETPLQVSIIIGKPLRWSTQTRRV